MTHLITVLLILALLMPALPAKPRPPRCYLTGKESAMVCRCEGVSLPAWVCEKVNGKKR